MGSPTQPPMGRRPVGQRGLQCHLTCKGTATANHTAPCLGKSSLSLSVSHAESNLTLMISGVMMQEEQVLQCHTARSKVGLATGQLSDAGTRLVP